MKRTEIQSRVAALDHVQRERLAAKLATKGHAGAGETQLVAYVEGTDVSSATVLNTLRDRLPTAMVPRECVVLESLPRNANGKVDREALLELTALGSSGEDESRDSAPRDDVERALATMWQELLGIGSPGVHDDFRDLGGHSLLALRLTSAIQKRFDVAFPVAAVFQYPTIAQLAEVIRGRENVDLSGAVVPIQKSGSRDPLFCVHCVNGRVNQYYMLAEALGDDQPVYGLQPPSMDGSQDIPDSMQELARRHVEEIRRVQPHGPYHLCGYSFGGLLAFEMAQQLLEAGQTVGTLAMFDTVLLRNEGLQERRLRHGERMQGLGPLGRAHYLARSGFGNAWTLLRQARTRIANARVSRSIRRHRQRSRPLPVDLRHIFVQRGLRRAMAGYEARPYPGRVLLFKADEETWMSQEYPNLGWDGIPRDGLEIELIHGGHGAILGDEVAATSARLRRSLEGH